VVEIAATLAVAIVCAFAEWLHAHRVRRVARLALGETERPRRWVRGASPVRVAGMTAAAWGLVTLLHLGSAASGDPAEDRPPIGHLVIALDVSPSMQLVDAGPAGGLSRGGRGREVLRSLLSRLDANRTRVSVIAFYTTARPVVIDTFDQDVVANILDDLPLEHAFAGGKTNLYAAATSAAEIARPWRHGSARLLVVSDGDTLPTAAMPTLPASFADVVIAGVGNPDRGIFIDGHASRQDALALERLALRLGGTYYDVNSRPLPGGVAAAVTASPKREEAVGMDARQLALAVVAVSAVAIAVLPPLLALFGSAHRPRTVARRPAAAGARPLVHTMS
jgi:Ca-activated chloride channel family protein